MSKKYDTFAAYLEDVYYNQIFSKIKSYLFNNKGRLDLSTSVVPDPSYVELIGLNARLLFVLKLKFPDVVVAIMKAIQLSVGCQFLSLRL